MRRDLAARTRLAKEFLGSGESQAAFSKRTGIPPRTLRSWVALLRPQDPRGQALDIVRKARADLDALLQVLEAAAGSPSLGPSLATTAEPVVSPVGSEQPVTAGRQKEAPKPAQRIAAAEVSPSQPPSERGSPVTPPPGHGSRRWRNSFFADM